MDDGSLPWIISIVLVFLAAFFAITETALASASRSKIKLAFDRGDSRGKSAIFCMDHFEDAISTLLICTNIVHISVASIVTVSVTKRWGLSAVSISTIITTIVVFFAGEMLPKSIAKKKSEELLLSTAKVLQFLMLILKPLSKFLASIGILAKKFSKQNQAVSVTEDELLDMIEDMAEEGQIDEDRSDLISSALAFKNVSVETVVTPRVDVKAISIDADPEEILSYIKKQNHSRIPVYKDTIDNIVGVLQIRNFLKASIKDKKAPKLKDFIDRVYYTSMTTKIDELLPIMSSKKLNMAVVTDNYGGTLGIVTIEDILEELVGEIWDEEDVIKESIKCLSDNMYSVNGDETVADLFDEIDFEDPEDNDRFQNLLLSEWALEHFAEIPHSGDGFEYYGLQINVSEISHNRIKSLRIVINRDSIEKRGEA